MAGEKNRNEEIVLKYIKEKRGVSPRDLEKSLPYGINRDEARVAIQDLLAKGKIRIDDNLKLSPL